MIKLRMARKFIAVIIGISCAAFSAAVVCPSGHCSGLHMAHPCCAGSQENNKSGCPEHEKKAPDKSLRCCGQAPGVIMGGYSGLEPRSVSIFFVAGVVQDFHSLEFVRTLPSYNLTGPPGRAPAAHLSRAPPNLG